MSALNVDVLTHFQKAFGPPHNSIATDYHWAIKPPASGTLPINVLVNGGEDQVVVWVFDPNDQSGKILRKPIDTQADAEQMVHAIQSRISEACRPMGLEN